MCRILSNTREWGKFFIFFCSAIFHFDGSQNEGRTVSFTNTYEAKKNSIQKTWSSRNCPLPQSIVILHEIIFNIVIQIEWYILFHFEIVTAKNVFFFYACKAVTVCILVADVSRQCVPSLQHQQTVRPKININSMSNIYYINTLSAVYWPFCMLINNDYNDKRNEWNVAAPEGQFSISIKFMLFTLDNY